MNYAVVAIGSLILLTAVSWIFWGRLHFTGPVRTLLTGANQMGSRLQVDKPYEWGETSFKWVCFCVKIFCTKYCRSRYFLVTQYTPHKTLVWTGFHDILFLECLRGQLIPQHMVPNSESSWCLKHEHQFYSSWGFRRDPGLILRYVSTNSLCSELYTVTSWVLSKLFSPSLCFFSYSLLVLTLHLVFSLFNHVPVSTSLASM